MTDHIPEEQIAVPRGVAAALSAIIGGQVAIIRTLTFLDMPESNRDALIEVGEKLTALGKELLGGKP